MSNIGILSTKENNSYLVRELRSDHAGEMGAVYIYKGIAAIAKITNDSELLNLARTHGATLPGSN